MTTEQRQEIFNSLLDATKLYKGKYIYKDNKLINTETSYILPCCKKIDHFKIYIDKIWSGNGFGNTSIILIVDTNTGVIKEINQSYMHFIKHTFS